MNAVNQKIIQAVMEKAKKVCPESLSLIGVYGSVATGDAYEKSDLDLLILIRDEKGYSLATGFLLEDRKVGYDLYCTTWESLRENAQCHHAQLSKLLDSKIVYVDQPADYEHLQTLRAQAKEILQSETRFFRAEKLIGEAKAVFGELCLRETLGQARLAAFGVMSYLMDAAMLFHGKYFRYGTKRMLEELAALPVDKVFFDNIRRTTESKDISELKDAAKNLILYAEGHFVTPKEKRKPSEDLRGTYEEMFSNWRNKVEEAGKNQCHFACFANMCSFQYMLDGISSEFDVGTYKFMESYDPNHLENNIKVFDDCLKEYENAYKRAGIAVKTFSNADAFAQAYLKQEIG